MIPAEDVWQAQLDALGAYIRSQRQIANLSLREMARLTDLSNAYLSQVERGLHQPSVRVLRSVADALNLSLETLLQHAGMVEDEDAGETHTAGGPERTVAAILADPTLSSDQKDALLSVYRSYSARSQEPAAGDSSSGLQ